MLRRERSQASAGVNHSYKIISRWMHKTLTEWQSILNLNGAEVLIYEEYIDSSTNIEHFAKFILLLSRHCPNLTHVRLLFSGEKSDYLEQGFIKSLWQLPHLKCLSLFDTPDTEFFALKDDSNKLTTLKIDTVDENVTASDFSNICGSLINLQNMVCEYVYSREIKMVAGLSSLSTLKSLTLFYPPENELKQLKNCNQLEALNLYKINSNLSSDDFLDIFKEKRNLHSLSICLIDSKLSIYLSELATYCPKLISLTINLPIKDIGSFVNLKYVGLDMDGEPCLSILETKEFFENLTQLQHLQFLSLDTTPENLNENEALLKIILNCTNLRYLRLPYKTQGFNELILNLPNYLSKRNFQPKSPFVLSVQGSDALTDVEDKLKAHPRGELLHLDWNGKMFASELKSLSESLGHSDAYTDDRNIFKFPGKVAGDSFGPVDRWSSNANYKLALKSCTNKFNLDYDEELIKRCRDFTINNAEYEISNMEFAFNLKYDSIDEDNKFPEAES
ncbi:uncharacterized protein LOC6558445 [Drosophila grimshawi]|nr:uncharacterized protein LOC6558445 [Drosophila grimshawi]